MRSDDGEGSFLSLSSCDVQSAAQQGAGLVAAAHGQHLDLHAQTLAQLGERLGVKVEVLPVGGGDEARALLRSGLHIARRKR